jgi:hypothetical protein
MRKPGDLDTLDKLVMLGLLVVGVAGMIARPDKTWRLIVHGRGWYE